MKKILLVSTLGLITLIGLAAMAKHGHSQSGFLHHGHDHQKLQVSHEIDFSKELNLSEEQIAQAKKMKENFIKELSPLINQIKPEREKLVEIHKKEINGKEFEKQKKLVNNLSAKVHKLHANQSDEFKKILNKEQKIAYKKLKEERIKKIHETHKK